MNLNFTALFLSIILICPAALAGEAEVVALLSARHTQDAVSLKELEELAGGQDSLIETLLKHRRAERPPFVGIRAERLLLNYSDREEVISALESDINDTKYFGLARTIGTHIDTVKANQARTRLATAVLRRAQTESRFRMFGKMLLESSDSNVKRLAREAELE